MARPKKDGDKIRADTIEVRLTADEKTAIKQNAKNAGLTPSDFIRLLALNPTGGIATGTKRIRHVPTDDQELLIRLKGEIGKLGSNVNQIARALNQRQQDGELTNVPDHVITNAMYGVDTVTKHLLELLNW